MNDVLKAIMAKKGKGKRDQIDPAEQAAMLHVLKDIHGMASEDMGHDVKGLKKVTVASNSPEGLQMGLHKAEDLVQEHHHGLMDDENANEASDDMHPESQRHQLQHNSETTDQEDAMADPDGDVDDEKGMADGGEVDLHQSMEDDGVDSDEAPAIINKEKDKKKVSPAQHSEADKMQEGTHGAHGPVDPADEYSDLEPEDLEALIAHLMKKRK